MKLITVAQSLRGIVGDEEFREAADVLITEDEELADLLYQAKGPLYAIYN